MFFRKDNSGEIINAIKKMFLETNQKIDEALKQTDEWNKNETLFNLIDEKDKALIELISLKDDIAVKDKTIKDQAKEIEEYKEKVKNLSLDYSKNMDYKSANEELAKKLKKSNKDLATYEELYGKLPKKVPGSTMPRKGQTLGIKESKTSASTKKILKETNELREKEATNV
ncbi:MAG: hypothetical protein NC483_00710 [Ruminococcus sp.]|nr:hypothetical protein [Ruminococcus sp.]